MPDELGKEGGVGGVNGNEEGEHVVGLREGVGAGLGVELIWVADQSQGIHRWLRQGKGKHALRDSIRVETWLLELLLG